MKPPAESAYIFLEKHAPLQFSLGIESSVLKVSLSIGAEEVQELISLLSESLAQTEHDDYNPTIELGEVRLKYGGPELPSL